jgi:hypothetical protein
MTSSSLSALVGHSISAIDEVHDYLQLKFDNGDVLNVFNAYSLDMVADIRSLVGRRVTVVAEEPKEVRLEMGALRLSVDLSDAAFRGPEAIEYIPTSGSRVVWS